MDVQKVQRTVGDGPEKDAGEPLSPTSAMKPPASGIDPSQAWFWTPEWQAKEREADADIAAGRVKRFDDVESFLAYLDE